MKKVIATPDAPKAVEKLPKTSLGTVLLLSSAARHRM